ncbi:MAG: TIR domain-containing protein [Pyrinomonadaceae bacterium]
MSRPSVFISYSHKDDKEKNELLLHLGVLRGAGLIDLWSDDRIGAGGNWEAEISRAMSQAKVAILLISANFLNSSFILNREVPTLLERRKAHGLTVFPVIAKHCPWRSVKWLSEMNVRPKDDKPVWGDEGRRADEYLTAIAYEVADIIAGETSAVAEAPPPAPPRRPLRLFIVAPDGSRFETEVTPDVLVSHVQSDFLASWAEGRGGGEFESYALRLGPDSPRLDTTLSLVEASITDGTVLHLTREQLLPTSPVGIIVEDQNGCRYVTSVQLDTPVKTLAGAFVNSLGGGEEATAELFEGASGPPRYRTLRSDATLYDERVGPGSRIRITPEARGRVSEQVG